MAQPRLRARFFVMKNGVSIIRAEPLKESFRAKYLNSHKLVCAFCNEQLSRFRLSHWMQQKTAHIDHILPRSRGGQNIESNLRILCHCCNMSKGAK